MTFLSICFVFVFSCFVLKLHGERSMKLKFLWFTRINSRRVIWVCQKKRKERDFLKKNLSEFLSTNFEGKSTISQWTHLVRGSPTTVWPAPGRPTFDPPEFSLWYNFSRYDQKSRPKNSITKWLTTKILTFFGKFKVKKQSFIKVWKKVKHY